jgi:hypothetical protein
VITKPTRAHEVRQERIPASPSGSRLLDESCPGLAQVVAYYNQRCPVLLTHEPHRRSTSPAATDLSRGHEQNASSLRFLSHKLVAHRIPRTPDDPYRGGSV